MPLSTLVVVVVQVDLNQSMTDALSQVSLVLMGVNIYIFVKTCKICYFHVQIIYLFAYYLY